MVGKLAEWEKLREGAKEREGGSVCDFSGEKFYLYSFKFISE